MATVHEIEQRLFSWAPRESAMDWDNVGHLVGDPEQEVEHILVALDITERVVQEAIDCGAQLIVSHHPVMNVRWHEREMQTLRPDTRLGGVLTTLVKNDISAICMHTNLDAADGGVNDCLAKKLGLNDIFLLNDEKIGRIGTLSCEKGLEEFLRDVIELLGCGGLRYCRGSGRVRRVYPAGHCAGLRHVRDERSALQRFSGYAGTQPDRRGAFSDGERRLPGGQDVFGGAFPRGENRNIDVAQRRHSILSVRRDHIMSGHSKWHNIQKTKGAADAKRSAAFTKIAKEIIVAVKQGGSGDPNNNSRLATVIAKAKAANMPNDNIKRTIDKALGSGNTDNYESVTYEGYGPGGVAVIVEALTDNRQRTAPEVRHYFDKYGKGMGAQGCVSWSFDRKGVIIIDNEDGDYDEDAVMMDALDAGADDFNAEDNVFEITTDPDAFNDVVKALEEKNYAFVSADISLVPQTYVKLESDEDIKNMEKLLDMLDDNEDVQNTYHNWDQD